MKNLKNVKFLFLPVTCKKMEGKKDIKVYAIVSITMICILLLFSGYTLAKSIEKKLINVNTQISKPILKIDNEPNLVITEAEKEGIYQFKIRNYDEEENITDVRLHYFIEILGNIENGINITLYENENQLELKNQKTDYIEISKNEKEERVYKIRITYDKSELQSISDIMQKIQVKVHTEQMEG